MGVQFLHNGVLTLSSPMLLAATQYWRYSEIAIDFENRESAVVP